MSSEDDANKVIKMIKIIGPSVSLILIGFIMGWLCKGLF